MRKLTGLTLTAGILFLAAACNKSYVDGREVAAGVATLQDSAGRTIGAVALSQWPDGVLHVHVEVTCAVGATCTALSAGDHGIHFHSVGSCVAASSPAFSSAGGHFNPLGKQHGLSNAAGPHAGDAPNLTIGTNGRATANFTTNRVTLTGGASSLLDADGSAIVIHAGPDDQMSQPAGNSGARVACGVVKSVPTR